MYTDSYSKEISKKLAKIKKKDSKHYEIICKKRDWVLANPNHRYKDLHYTMKRVKRVHIGHFVLIFKIDYINKIVSFEDYDHHDNIYKR